MFTTTPRNIHVISFCEPFIERLADLIDDAGRRDGQDLRRLALVFGGKRPALFVKRELARRRNGDFFPPAFFTIDEFIGEIVRRHETFESAADMDNAYLLYQLAQRETPDILQGRAGFAEFLPWAREILAFIDQLDLELIDNAALSNVEANARIGYEVPADINRMLQRIVTLRDAYHRAMRGRQRYSRGLQYRRASELAGQSAFGEFDRILFCNFFYFNRCEELVVKSFYERGQAALIFQGDQRKWPILDHLSRRFAVPVKEGVEVDPTSFDLKLYRGFDLHSQVGIVREILKTVKDPERTVVVLPQPAHLVPLLSQLVQVVPELNVSMGYPLTRSSIYTLFQLVFQTQLTRKDDRYYSRDYLRLLRHPLLKNLRLGGIDPAVTRILIHKIEEILTGRESADISGMLFCRPEDIEASEAVYTLSAQMLARLGLSFDGGQLRQVLTGLHDLVLRRWQSVEDFTGFSGALAATLAALADHSALRNYPLNVNIVDRLMDVVEEFGQAEFSREHFSQEEIFRIFENTMARAMVAFHGSPLKGLQVLGLFETRSLNFDNVIVLDVNEGTLPNLRIHDPLIPREIMIGLKLDRVEMDEEIQRYQFMRLISSARKVHLVYQEGREHERSRFIEELLWEEEKAHGRAVTRPQPAAFSTRICPEVRTIAKTPAMVEALRAHRFSASSLNTYLQDPIEFYTRYVLGLREEEDLLEEPEARQVGTFVHNLLEELYKPFLRKAPVIDAALRRRCEQLFEQYFSASFGRNLRSDAFLLKTVLEERVRRFLDYEEKVRAGDVKEILYLEKYFEDTMTLAGHDIRFGYIVDRVERLRDGTVMILDYKTGSTSLMPRPAEDILDTDLSRDNLLETVKSFQIPLYVLFMQKQFPGEPLNAGLYNLRTLKLDSFVQSGKNADPAVVRQAFTRALDFIMGEILDPEVPFIKGVKD